MDPEALKKAYVEREMEPHMAEENWKPASNVGLAVEAWHADVAGAPYDADATEMAVVFEHNGTQYGMALLTNKASNEHVALLAGGLFRKHIL